MNWFQENRFLGRFLAGFGAATLACLILLWLAKGRFEDAKMEFDQQAAEMGTLQRHVPFPTEANLRKVKTQAEEYATALTALKEELKTRALPVAPLAPNEFQTRLNQARAAFVDKARTNKVKLPDNFFLGFDEFAGALPDTQAAPLLGQELAQVEMLLNILLDARVSAIGSFRRVPLAERSKPVATPAPVAGRKPLPAAAPSAPLVERNVIDFAFTSTPGAARRVLNQIGTAPQQICVVRTLRVLNEKEKGPPREGIASETSAPAPGAAQPARAGLHFIVGNEHVETSARIEMLRFTF